jgi:hypothetical protein
MCNYIPNGGRSQEGGRQTALLPQKTRKFYSFKAVKKALSNKLWKQAYVPVNVFRLFTKKDDKPVGACLGADPHTIARIFDFAREHNLAVLHSGIFFLRKETAEKLRENRKIAKGDREKLAKLDLHAVSGPDKLVRLAFRVFIDIDNKDTKALWRLIKYLWKLKIYPKVWETKNGYHVYIYFYHRKIYRVVSVEDEDGKKRVEKVFQGYELHFAKDYRVRHVVRGLKELCSKVGVEADIVSATHSVWVEGVPNPLKDGFVTKRILTGKPLPLEDLWQKTLPLWLPKELFRKPRYRVRKPKNEEKAEDAQRELKSLLKPPYSNVFFALSRHGTLKACKKLLDAGYELQDIENELKDCLEIRTTSDKKALENFLAYLEANYTKHTHKQKSPPKEEEHKEEERKQEHWEDLAVRVIEAWKKGHQKISHIARYLGISRSKIYHMLSFMREHGYEFEDLFTKSEEVLAFLRAHRKGGNKWQRKKEWDREAWLKKVQRRTAEFIQRCKEEAQARREKKREELWEKGIDPDGWYSWWQIPVLFESVQVGNIQFDVFGKGVVRVGITSPNRPLKRKKKTEKQKTFKTPAVPLVLPSRVFTPSTQQALFDLLKRYHSDAGLPVVLIVPRKFALVRDTLLQITPYRVPPSQLHQLWKEIKEKFGKTVQGLSTKNGALDWFLRVWEKLKDHEKGLVVVSSSPFKDKQLSATTPPDKPSKKAESKAHPKLVLLRQELFALEHLFKANPDKKISELMPEMSESSRRVFERVQLVLKKEFARLQKLKEKGKLPPLLPTVEAIVRFLEHSFPGLLSLSPVVFRRLLDTVLRNCEAIYGSEPVLHELKGKAGTYFEFLTAIVRLQEKPKTQVPAGTHIPIAKGKELSTKKKADKKPSFPPSHVIKTVMMSFEERVQGRDVIVVSRQELETAIYTAWRSADKEKVDRKAVSLYVDRFEGVLWRKLDNGNYGLLVSSNTVAKKIRDYVRELKQARKNGKGQTPTNGNGSLGSELSTSQPSNGNGKYDIDHIIHTLEEKGSVVVPPQFVHEIVRELRRRGLSVKYWPATGLIELVGGDDEIPF